MCSGSQKKPSSTDLIMEREKQEGLRYSFSILLELSASYDLDGFKRAVKEEGHDVEASYWYGRLIGSKKMGFEERTPLMIAAMFGSKNVLKYILQTCLVDVNRACGSDRATALHCATAGGSSASAEVVELLLAASANASSLDANGNQAGDLIAPAYSSTFNSRKKSLEVMLKGLPSIDEPFDFSEQMVYEKGWMLRYC